ncbi:transposase [Streptomyces sp. BK205]|uniref:transposase n=1 Tax=Streptomyces sp. BK205 TaxID=2512164 RepID=UPI0014050F25|nr:transposase [Streptomyces sp. BK205]
MPTPLRRRSKHQPLLAHPGQNPAPSEWTLCPWTSRGREDAECTGNIDGKGRHILLLPESQQKIQKQVRKDQKTSHWQRRYAIRAGCEATVSETVHAHGLRHCRYCGLAKTHVQHVLTAAGANIIRLSEHFPPGTTPASPPRPPSHFQQLCRRLPT